MFDGNVYMHTLWNSIYINAYIQVFLDWSHVNLSVPYRSFQELDAEITSKSFVLGIHRKSSKPPPSLCFGKFDRIILSTT